MFSNTKEIITKTFDEASLKFDQIGTPFFSHYGKVMTDLSEIKPDDCILDIACGKGAATFPISDKLTGKGQIYGIDISSKMIDECKRRMNISGNKDIHFMVMDAENLDFTDNSFDKIICSFGLFFLTDIEKGFNEIKRVLKPGGLLVFSSWNKDYQLKWQWDIIRKYVPVIRGKVEISEDKIQGIDFNSLSGLEKILSISGFKKEQIFVENIDCYYNTAEEWIETRWHTAFRMYFEQFSKEEYESVKSEIVDQLQSYKENDRFKIEMSAFITKAIKT